MPPHVGATGADQATRSRQLRRYLGRICQAQGAFAHLCAPNTALSTRGNGGVRAFGRSPRRMNGAAGTNQEIRTVSRPNPVSRSAFGVFEAVSRTSFGPVWPGSAPAGSQNGKAERDAWLPAPGRLNARAGTIQGILRPPKGLVPRLGARYGVRRIAVHGRSLNVREAAHQRAERVGGHTVVARLLGRGNRLA